MNPLYFVLPLLTAAVSAFVFFWVGHEHGVRSCNRYRLMYLENDPEPPSGNVRVVYNANERPS